MIDVDVAYYTGRQIIETEAFSAACSAACSETSIMGQFVANTVDLALNWARLSVHRTTNSKQCCICLSEPAGFGSQPETWIGHRRRCHRLNLRATTDCLRHQASRFDSHGRKTSTPQRPFIAVLLFAMQLLHASRAGYMHMYIGVCTLYRYLLPMYLEARGT